MDIEKLKKEVDLLSYIVKGGGQVERIGPDKFRMNPCPVCNHRDHFTIYTETNSYSSFNDCCKGGSVIDYLMEVEGMAMSKAIERLETIAGGEGKKTLAEKEDGLQRHYNSPEEEATQKRAAAHLIESAAGHDTDYYIKRGLSVEVIGEYKLGYLPEGCNYSGYGPAFKYVIPITDDFVILRSDNGQIKYKNFGQTEIFNAKHIEDPALPAGDIYITEGVFDALSLETMKQAAVALNGVNMAGRLCLMLRKNREHLKGKTLVLALDNDDAGRQAARKIKAEAKESGLHCIDLPLKDYHDVNDYLMADRDGLKRAIDNLRFQGSVFDYLQDDFELDQKKRMEEKDISTGLTELDNALGGGLYPGLYVMGSIPSLGKTAFVLQVADYIAGNRQDVLFFSLEMSSYELVCRSLSRILHEQGSDIATGNVLNSHYKGEDLYSLKEYKAALHELREGPGRFMTIKEGDFTADVKAIRADVQEYIYKTKRRPVIVIDYLQVLRPLEDRKTDKQNIDMTIVELKRLSRDLDLPVLVVSSFSRQFYNEQATFKSFKESGSVEYTADVLMVMKLRNTAEDEDQINELKNKEPRDLTLVLLKNRRGRAYEKIDLDYWPRFNYFKVSPETKTIKRPY